MTFEVSYIIWRTPTKGIIWWETQHLTFGVGDYGLVMGLKNC